MMGGRVPFGNFPSLEIHSAHLFATMLVPGPANPQTFALSGHQLLWSSSIIHRNLSHSKRGKKKKVCYGPTMVNNQQRESMFNLDLLQKKAWKNQWRISSNTSTSDCPPDDCSTNRNHHPGNGESLESRSYPIHIDFLKANDGRLWLLQ